MKRHILLFLLLVTAFAARVWGVRFCLPFRYSHIDESVVIFYTMRFFGGSFNPSPFFDYPTLGLYILFIVYSACLLAGRYASVESFVTAFMNDASSFYMTARFLSVLAGVFTVYLTYLLGKKFFSRKTGLIAALFLSLTPRHILDSHYGTVDALSLFFTLLSAIFIYNAALKSRIRDWLLAGLFVGLSAASKYYGAIFLINILIAYMLCARKRWYFPVLSVLSCMAGFVAAFPYSVLDFGAFSGRFVDRLHLIIGNGTGMQRAILDTGWFLYPAIIAASCGFLFAMISFIALIYNLFHRKKENLLAISFIIVFYLFSGGWRVVTERYALPFYPFFAIISADFLLTVRERIKERKIKDIFLPCVITLFLITVLPSIVRMDRILAGKDTRIIAYEWLKDNIPRKSRILREPFTPEFGSTDDYRVKVDWQETIQQEDVERLALDYDYVLTANFDYDTASAFEGRLDKDAVLVREFSGERLGTFHNPRVRIYKLRGAKWENRKSW